MEEARTSAFPGGKPWEGLSSLKTTALVAALAATGPVPAGCGGGGDSDALRKEVEALRQQVAATSTTVPPRRSRPRRRPPRRGPGDDDHEAAHPDDAAGDLNDSAADHHDGAAHDHDHSTVRQAGGHRDVDAVKDPRPNGPTCVAFTYTIFNRSDTALKDVKFTNVYNQETYKDADGIAKNRWGNPSRFPEQTVAAGIAPYGQGDVQVNWCPDSITPGTTAQFPVHIGEGRGAETATTALSWNWFLTWPSGARAPFPGCCAWWDQNTKDGPRAAVDTRAEGYTTLPGAVRPPHTDGASTTGPARCHQPGPPSSSCRPPTTPMTSTNTMNA